MTWEEYRDMTRLLLKFNSLSSNEQELILLAIDGLKARANEI